MIWFRCGIVRNLTMLESRPKIPPMASRTLDGFFPQTDKRTSCLSHLMHGCLTLSTSLLYLPPLPPSLISPMWPLDLDGMIVIVHSFPTLFYSPLTFFWYSLSFIPFPVLVFYLFFSLFSIFLCCLFFLELQWYEISEHLLRKNDWHWKVNLRVNFGRFSNRSHMLASCLRRIWHG